jgi:ABC-type nitrate/sulfonate/bicarbonate transport system substrate-binding protein
MRHSLTRRRLIGTGGALLGAASTGLRPAWGQGLTPVTMQLSWLHSVQFGGTYLAEARGYFAEEGIEVTLRPGGPNAPVAPPMVAGQALLGLGAADYDAAAVAEGAPLKIIGVQMQRNPFAIASLPDNPVNVPADLVGKRLGMALINMPILQTICTLNGVDVGDIEVVPTQYDAAPLLQGQADALLCWATDLPVAMAVQGVESVTMLLADHGYAVHAQTYIVTEDTLAARRADIVRMLRADARGWGDYVADPGAAAALTVARFPDLGLDARAQRLQAERQAPLMVSAETEAHGFGWFTDESVQANIETLALLGQEVSPDLWDRSVLEEVHGG